MTNKKVAIYIIFAALVGGVIGSLISNHYAQAFSLKDFLRSLVPSLNIPAVFSPKPQTGNNPAPEYVPTVDYEQKIIQAVQESAPGVVSIIISKNVPVIENCSIDPLSGLPDEFRQFFGDGGGLTEPCQKGTALKDIGGGSGFIIDSDGTIVTNKHVASDEKASYAVFTNDGKKYDAKILARDPLLDIAILKIDTGGLPVLPIGDSDSVKLGQSVIAIGNALGEFRNTVSVGVVSGLRRNVTASGGSGLVETIEGVIQTDAAINPGNSGGPLLNLKGEVIGINTAVASGAQSVGFAIPINQVKRAIKSIKQNGKIIVPYIGVRFLAVTDELAAKEKLGVGAGALLRGNDGGSAVIKGGPADKAGLKTGDIITEVNGEKIDADHSLSSLIQKYSVGDVIQLALFRGGSTLNVDVTLEERNF